MVIFLITSIYNVKLFANYSLVILPIIMIVIIPLCCCPVGSSFSLQINHHFSLSSLSPNHPLKNIINNQFCQIFRAGLGNY